MYRVAIFSAFILVFAAMIASTPLDDYVNAPDPHFKYELIKTYDLTGFKLYILNMTSQKWQDESVVTNPIWWHFLCVTIPDKIQITDAAALWIDGGNNNNDGKYVNTCSFYFNQHYKIDVL